MLYIYSIYVYTHILVHSPTPALNNASQTLTLIKPHCLPQFNEGQAKMSKTQTGTQKYR